MTENEKWIKQSCEREELAKKLIEMGTKDFEELDELKNVPVETLQTWIIEALEEENKTLREKIILMNEQEARDIRTRFPC